MDNYKNMKLNLKRKMRKITKRDMLGVALLVILALGMRLGLNWGYEGVFFWLFFISLFYWRIDSRVSIGFALVGLISIMLMLALKQYVGMMHYDYNELTSIWWGSNKDALILISHFDKYAEKVAVWVYFFLVIGVVKQIWEYRVELKNEDEIIKKNT